MITKKEYEQAKKDYKFALEIINRFHAEEQRREEKKEQRKEETYNNNRSYMTYERARDNRLDCELVQERVLLGALSHAQWDGQICLLKYGKLNNF